MDVIVNMDSALTLDETRQRCEVEQAGVFQLEEIEIGTVTEDGQVFTVNKAGFNQKLSGLLPDLSFVEGSVKEKPGFTKLFDCDMFVENHMKHISVFGK